MNDAQSTIVGLKAQDCPGGGWTGQPAELEQATVADCLAHGVCGCIYGGAVEHIERLLLENWQLKGALGYPVPGDIPQGDFKCGLCEARATHQQQGDRNES